MNENVKTAASGFSQICTSTGNNCRLLVSFGSLSLETLGLYYCVKSVRIRSFSGPYFPAFGLEKLRIRTLFTQCAYLLKFRNKFQQISACYGLSTTTSAIRYVHVLYLIVLCHFKEFRNHSGILFSCPRA